MKSLSLVQTINRENLLTVAKEVPGARVGLKIAALLLVLEGQRPGRISNLLGLNHMALERCIHTVNQEGPLGLVPKQHTGRPTRLTPDAQQRLEQDLRKNPQEFGLSRAGWDGPTLVLHLKEHFGIRVKVRHAQRWMHKLGYRLKRAGYTYIQARAEDAHKFEDELKKTQEPSA